MVNKMKNLEMVIKFGAEGSIYFYAFVTLKKKEDNYTFSYYDPAPESMNIKDTVKRTLFKELSISSNDLDKGLKDVSIQLEKMLKEIDLNYKFFSYVSAQQLKYLCYTNDILSIKSS